MAEATTIAAAVRAHLVQALARRAEAHAGAARRMLDDRLEALAATPAPARHEAPAPAQDEVHDGARDEAHDEALASTPAPSRAEPPRRNIAPSSPGALARLVAHAAHQKAIPVLGAPSRPREAAPDKAPAPDSRTLQFFKRTWARLSADQRLAQSRATLPENAGPLNSHHLVHRSLALMRELSPDYLERFVGYVDALQWLEQANEAAAQEQRPASAKKSMAARR